jgi:DNA-binding CsgD family transcriptional regulator/tetratricopeptide (TPR) repeat protein
MYQPMAEPGRRVPALELVERDEELGVLHQAALGTKDGAGSVVLVNGEPGIGKTALVTRFAQEHAEGWKALWGRCDDLATARPLGAFRDLVHDLSEPLARSLRDGPAPEGFPRSLLEQFRADRRPTLLVLEDVHWADQATIDAITVIGRRLHDLPLVLVLTYRTGELAFGHPLRAAIDAVQGPTTQTIELAPLSREAVASLAGQDADRVFELSAGNPFFVIELLAHHGDAPPPSLANAVLGRVARLEVASRELLQLISMVPGRISTRVLDIVSPGWPTAAEQPERRQLSTSDAHHVRFRHELTRAAVRSSVPPGRRRVLHGRILDALLATGAEPADLVHHAEAAGATDVVAEHARVAARQAEDVGSNREAFAHYRRATAFADRLTVPERARLWEDVSRTAYLVGSHDEALHAADRALELHDQVDDREACGRTRSHRAHLHWYGGDGEAAWRDACAGIRDLEPAGASRPLALAYMRAAELAMLASRGDDAMRWADRAVRLAGDDEEIRLRAATSVGAVRMQSDPDDVRALVDALDSAALDGYHHLAVLLLISLAFVNLQWVRPDAARVHAEQGRRYARTHEVDTMAAYLEAIVAWLLARRGDHEQAHRLVSPPLDERSHPLRTVVHLQARTVLTELAVRRGEPDADARLAALARDADRTGELKRIGPVLELQVERAWTCGRALPVERFEEVARIVGHQALRDGSAGGRIAAWATVCDLPNRFGGRAPEPHAAMLVRDWLGAAEAFGAVGWSHDRALMLSLLDDQDALVEALELARSLQAAPLERRVVERMRSRGLSIPRGPTVATRSNPAELTDRQYEVVTLVCRGRSNAEIAGELHISPRTAEHHVANILEKLGVSSRAEAVARCAELGIIGAD